MSEALAFLDGQFLPISQARLPLHDAGFVMGATVTDLCRTFRHKLYRWNDHLARFRASCQATEIVPPFSDEEISVRAEQLVHHNAAMLNATDDLALVLFATPGPVGYYLGEPGGVGNGPITFGMHTFPLPFARYRSWVERGAALAIPAVRQLPAECIPPHVKMRSRLHWWLADRQARRIDPGAVALLLDETGGLTETAAANLLIVQDGQVVSPPRERILGGISLRVVVELCAKLRIPYTERPLLLHDLQHADEALLLSTPYCLVGVSRCNTAPLTWPGPLYRRLLEAWNEEVGLDIHAQIVAPREPVT